LSPDDSDIDDLLHDDDTEHMIFIIAVNVRANMNKRVDRWPAVFASRRTWRSAIRAHVRLLCRGTKIYTRHISSVEDTTIEFIGMFAQVIIQVFVLVYCRAPNKKEGIANSQLAEI
jgi:hypothetical protein